MKTALGVLLLISACGGGSTPIGGPPPTDAPTGTSPDGPPGAPDATPSIPDGAPGTPDAAPGGIATCGSLSYATTFALMPAPTGAHYLRCDSRGPEHGARVIVSADASRVASITTAGTVRLFATAPWSELAQLGAPLGRIDAIAFSPDSATLATLSPEMGIVTLWHAADGTRGATYTAPQPAFMMDHLDSALEFDAGGSKLATSLGMVIDLAAGTTTPIALGESSHQLGFAPGDATLFVDQEFQIGNSPLTTALLLVDLASNTTTTLYQAYTRALLGQAVSPDHALLGFGQTQESGAPGLREYRVATGVLVASVPGFTGTVLGYSPDSAQLYTWDGHVVSTLDASDLHVLGTAPVTFTVDQFLGVSPDGHLVAAGNGVTTWTDPASGAIARTMTHALTSASWNGGYGVGSDGDAMFVMWRESDATALCTPAGTGGTLPALSSLGTVLADASSVTSQDGSTSATSTFYLHGHSTNYYTVDVTDSNGNSLRSFPPSASRGLAMSEPDAAHLYTLEGGDTAVAGWCR